jgi:uncharacterized protein DUF4157
MLVQTKLDVGPARDRYEAEADRIADRVMRADMSRPAAPPAISRLVAPSAQRIPAEDPRVSSKRNEIKTHKIDDEGEDESTTVQKKGDGPVAAPARAETAIGRMRAAGGEPLGASVRGRMEHGLGRSLNQVRIHDSPAAAGAARDVGARAFSVGNHVFFGAGQNRPDTLGGLRLLAHELVHTEQQKGLGHRAQTMALQRNTPNPDSNNTDEPPADPGRVWTKPGSRGTRIELNEDRNGGRIYLPRLKLPQMRGGYKGASNHPQAPGVPDAGKNPLTPGTAFVYKGKTGRGSDTARQQFLRSQYFQSAEQELEPTLLGVLPDKIANWSRGANIVQGGVSRKYLRKRGGSADDTHSIIFGTPAELADHELIKMPNWDRGGRHTNFDVDHAHELQLGGLDGWDNFWLLEASSNRSSGSKISSELSTAITGVISSSQEAGFWTGPNEGKRPSFESIKAGSETWDVEFAGFTNLSVAGDKRYWTRAQILAGDHLSKLRAMSEPEIVAQGLVFEPGSRPEVVSVFAKPNGGFRRRFTVVEDGSVTPDAGNDGFFYGFNLSSAEVTQDLSTPPYIVKLNGEAFRRRRGRVLNPTPVEGENGIPVKTADGMGFSGYLDQAVLRERIRAIPTEAVGASPVTFHEAGITSDGVLFADGVISATKALFPGLEIPIFVRGTDVFVEFPIPTDRLNFGPVSVTEAALQLGVGDNGVFVSGMAMLEVSGVGSGMVQARVDQDNTIITGMFNFDLDFLDPAQAMITYNYGEDSLALTLRAGVQQGRLPGIESGTVTATFTRDNISVSGELQVGGALSGTVVSISYSEEAGLSIGAENIPLPVERIPGVSSATAALFASRDPSTGEWTFGGSGTAMLDIAGASGEIMIGVEEDKVIFSGNLNVAKGPASGSITFTATNAPMDEDGNVVEGEATDAITVFGRGTAEITFGRILRGSATIILSPDASITISGTIGLPPTFEVFPRREFNRDLFTIETPDFPIWGVSLGGVGIGIFAFADATVSFNSYVGPGQLIDTEVTATMDLDAPADAIITGSARFIVPAFAGLRLDLGGGLRARLAVAFVEGRVGLDGELGVEADASAGVEVEWNRNDGLSVEADVEANARPKFRLGINASVTAGVDLVLTEITKTWGPWRRTLGEFGPDMELGVTIPVVWNEQNGLDFSLDDIEVRRPQLNARDLMSDAFDTLV